MAVILGVHDCGTYKKALNSFFFTFIVEELYKHITLFSEVEILGLTL